MKTLYLFRHAKSCWKDQDVRDYDRDLSKRGEKDIILMTNILKKKNILPDYIISSPAKRTTKTTKQIQKILNIKNAYYDKNIYEASMHILLNIISNLDNKYKNVFLVGHNNSLNEVASKLVDLNQNIPTSAFVHIQIDIDSWLDLYKVQAKLISFEYPKKYYK